MINHVSVAFSITPVISSVFFGPSSPAQPAPGQAVGGACDQGAQQFREEGAAQPAIGFRAPTLASMGLVSEVVNEKTAFNDSLGLRENLQESPIFNGKIYGFLQIFP